MSKLFALIAALSVAATTLAIPAKVGTNIGGWQVLEPWITPSLFYRFLGKTKSEGVGIDSWTLCEALGPLEGNKLMRAHWDAWLTEDHVKGLAERGVEIVRLPIGDWTLRQYGPYTGCMDGAEEKIQWFLDLCHKYKIEVLLDVHCVKDSQNGFDNSGQAREVTWSDETHFAHNDVANWMGPWNGTAYEYINYSNVDFALQTVDQLLTRWGNHPAVTALEPVNEPWSNSDMTVLKNFYRKVRSLMQAKTPHLTFVFHDAFQFVPDQGFLGFVAGQHGFAEAVFDRVDGHGHEVTDLHFEFAQVVLEFGQRHVGFRLQTGVDHHVVVFDANDLGGDDFARAHFGALEGFFEEGGKRFRH